MLTTDYFIATDVIFKSTPIFTLIVVFAPSNYLSKVLKAFETTDNEKSLQET